MANKVEAKEKKTTAAKSTAKAEKTTSAAKTSTAKKSTARTASKGKVSKGDAFACEVCGLTVIVDELGEVAVMPDFICCEQTMQKKSSRAKAEKK